MLSRRAFMAAGAVGGAGGSAAAQNSPQPAAPAGPLAPFADPDFGFMAQGVLGSSYYGGVNPGRLLAILPKVKAGDFESAFAAYHDAAVESRTLAEQALSKGHRVSAREAWLWAANYFYAAMRFPDGTDAPERALPTWKEYAACWAAAARLFDPPAERIEIPYEGTSLTGWFLRADGSGRRRPLIILNNGADGLENRMFVLGGAGALARGYNCLIFNGPGQGDSLWLKKLYFRPDWEKVITPVVDAMLRHPEVDARRIALVGMSMGGYMVPRALAFEKRIAAAVADPGIFDMSEPWFRNVPQTLRDMLDDGRTDTFDQILKTAEGQNRRLQMTSRLRMRPFGSDSYAQVFTWVRLYRLAGVVDRISCPVLITDPEEEQFFPGQSRQLFDALKCPKQLVRFTREQGAGQHCEVAAPGYRDFIIYNWLAETLA